MKIINSLAILIWFAATLYFGCGGLTSLELSENKKEVESMVIDTKDTVEVIYKGRSFKNISAANAYQEDENFKTKKLLAGKIFPWLELPYRFLGLLITSFAFGALGAIIAMLKDIAYQNVPTKDIKVFSRSLLGGGCGIIILSVSYILPILIVTGETQIRSLSIVFVCLFGGLFTEKFFEWLTTVFTKIFKN